MKSLSVASLYVRWPLWIRVTIVLWAGTLSPAWLVAEDGKTTIELSGRVINSQGEPVSGAVVAIRRFDGASLVESKITTDQAGKFTAATPTVDGKLLNLRLRATSADGQQLGYQHISGAIDSAQRDAIQIKLQPTKTASIKVIDSVGKPIVDAQVALQLSYPHTESGVQTDAAGVATLHVPVDERVLAVVAWKDDVGLDYRAYQLARGQDADALAKRPAFPAAGEVLTLDGVAPLHVAVTAEGQPLADVPLSPWLLEKESQPTSLNLSYFSPLFQQNTTAQGETTFRWIPAWQKTHVIIWPHTREYVGTRGLYDPLTGTGQLAMELDRLVPIRGRVVDADNNPAADVTIVARGAGYGYDGGMASAETDEQGKYELLVPPEQIYLVLAFDKQRAAAPQDGFAVFKNKPVENKDFKLRPATKVFGTLVDEETKSPMPMAYVYVYQYGQDLNSLNGIQLANPENSRRYIRPLHAHSATTDAQGRFEFALGDGDFDIRPPEQEKADRFEIRGQAELELQVTTKTQREVELQGLVVAKSDNTPIANARVSAVVRNLRARDWVAVSDQEGKFVVHRRQISTYVHAISSDKKLAGIAELGAEMKTLQVKLQPVGSAQGRLLNVEATAPVAGKFIAYGVRVPSENNETWSYRFGGRAMTAADGTFELPRLVPGWEYTLDLEADANGSIPELTKCMIAPGESLNLGDLPTPKPYQPYVPPTLEQQIQAAFEVSRAPIERKQRALELVKLANQHLLVVFGPPDDPRIHRLMEIRFQDSAFRPFYDEFRFLAIPTDKARHAAAVELAQTFDESLAKGRGDFLLVMLDRNGKKTSTADAAALCTDNKLSQDKLLEWLRQHLTQPLDAQQLLDDALRQAAKEGKSVIVQETATWCGPCHLLARFLDSHRVWEKDYVWVKMDHRWTGARDLMKKLRADAEGGIPWFAILDAEGKVLTTSNEPQTNRNIGFPSDKDAQAHFANMLNTTRHRLTGEEVNELIKALASSTAEEDRKMRDKK